MPARREHRDEIPYQEEVVELEHLLQDEQRDRQIVARCEIGLLDCAKPVLRIRFGMILARSLDFVWNAALNGALSVERNIGHFSPRTPDCPPSCAAV